MKYLGVFINNKPTWSAHTDYTVKKANGTIVLNFKHCSYIVDPILGYASIISSSPYQSTLIDKIESAHHPSACFILNNYERYSSVTNTLMTTGPAICRIIMMFKILKNAVHIPVEAPIFTFNILGTRGHSYKLYQLPTRINSYAISFFPDAIKLCSIL